MKWISQWAQNLAFFFLFTETLMNLLPESGEKKYIRTFLGFLLLLVLAQPLLKAGGLDRILEMQVLTDMLEQSYEETMQQAGLQDMNGTDYVKNACSREIQNQLQTLAESYGCEVMSSRVGFFKGDIPELKEIRLRLRSSEDRNSEEIENQIKNKVKEVYNIPGGNINISIQG
ncbi:MAG: stage III sporulation protein AF [Oliverpabstia sp.]